MPRVLVLMLLAACTDSGPDLDNTTPHVGPCGFTAPEGEATFEYDALGRVARIVGMTRDGRIDTVRTYDEAGDLATIITRVARDTSRSTTTWTFESERVTATIEECQSEASCNPNLSHRIYDRAAFQFFYPTWSAMVNPFASLGLIDDDGAPVITRVDAGRRTQRSVRDITTYDFDAAGRVVEFTLDVALDGLDHSEHRSYDGEHLVGLACRNGEHWRGLYDRGGNLAAEESTSAQGTVQIVYDYSCW